MNQPALFHEDIWVALRDCVTALGGNKKVGCLLRPEKGGEEARQWLRDCLAENHAQKINAEQILFILREAKNVGCHVGMSFICQYVGYAPPQPIEPEDERAALIRQFNESVKAQAAIVTRLERITP